MTYHYKDLEDFTLASLLNRSTKLYYDKPSVGLVGQKAIGYSEFMHKAVLDSIVMEKKGKLIAKIHLDYESIDKKTRFKDKRSYS